MLILPGAAGGYRGDEDGAQLEGEGLNLLTCGGSADDSFECSEELVARKWSLSLAPALQH